LRVLFIGDPHLKITKFDLSIRFLKWIEGVIAKEKPDIVVNLGDTFDSHAVLRSEIMCEFKEHIDRVMHLFSGGYIYILGNHDMYKPNDAKYHALALFKKRSRFLVVDKVTNFKNMTLVPYQHDLSAFPKKTLPICVAHQTFIGADYGYTRPDAGVDADSVSAEIIISGHVHLKQEFGKVIYPGSPFSQNINDIDQVKGLMLFNTETYERSFIRCPLPMWVGHKYEVNSSFTIDDLHSHLCGIINDHDHWVVEISGPKAEIIAYQSSDRYKDLVSGRNIRVKPVFTDKAKKQTKIEGVSMEHIVGEYFDKVYNGTIDKLLLVDKSLEILTKVRQSNAK
jgi:DNA repair exonuclease SbcCD nuclease subunit